MSTTRLGLAAIMAIMAIMAAVFGVSAAGQVNPPATVPQQDLTEYILGPGDVIVIMAIRLEEISNRPLRITAAGEVNLPFVGRLHAAGKTVADLEIELVERLRDYVREPQIAVNVTEFRSHPVSVLGAVHSPGLIQLDGRRRLMEVISMAGGLRDDANFRLQITREQTWGAIPLSSATVDPNGNHSVAEIDIRQIMNASRPEHNLYILPNDIITVPKADVVYVIGAVNKPGGYVLQDKDSISLLELLARAEGWTPTARPREAMILRPDASAPEGSAHAEIAVNLQNLTDRRVTDMTLQSEDILIVPDSYAERTFRSILGTTLQTLANMAIYRGF